MALASPLLQRGATVFLRRPRRTTLLGLDLWAPPGVFHPGLFFSTRAMAAWLQRQELVGREVLDLGTGSGALALVAARRGARVTALDVNPRALVAAAENAARVGVVLTLRAGDGLAALPAGAGFDLVVCNPPWFDGEARDDGERAFRGGAGMRFVDELFAGIAGRLRPGGSLVTVLGASADRARIDAIARRHGWVPERLADHRVAWEWQAIDRWRRQQVDDNSSM